MNVQALSSVKGAVVRRQEASPEATPETKPDSSLADAIRQLPGLMPAPQVVQVPAQIDSAKLADAIASAIKQATQKPVAYKFVVKRDMDGFIESIEARPIP